MRLVGETNAENTAKESLDVTGVIDASPQRCSLFEIVDADLVRPEISLQVLSSEPGDDIRRGLSFFQCTANTRNTVVVLVVVVVVGLHKDGEGGHLAIRVYSKSICGRDRDSEEGTHGEGREEDPQVGHEEDPWEGQDGRWEGQGGLREVLCLGHDTERGDLVPDTTLMEWVVDREEGRLPGDETCEMLHLR
jgi:hypothetical protein